MYILKKYRSYKRMLPIGKPNGNFSTQEKTLHKKLYYANTHHFNFLVRLFIRITYRYLWKRKYHKAIRFLLKKYGDQIERETGIKSADQRKGLIKLASGYNLPPVYYYKYKLFDVDGSVNNILFNPHYIPLYSYLFTNENSKIIGDKVLFEKMISSVIKERATNIAIINRSGIDFLNGKDSFPRNDLFVKPIRSHAGKNCFAIKYIDGNYSIDNGKSQLDSKELLAYLLKIGHEEPVTLQRFYKNHKDVSHLSNGSLATNRIATYIDQHGKPQILFSMFLMPVGKSLISNGIGGVISSVNLSNGKVGRGIKIRDPLQEVLYHPDTGKLIEGSVLPNWNKAKDLCLIAHDMFRDTPFIGWDIFYTKDGPKLLEGNLSWSIELWQMTHKNFDRKFFLDILEYHVRKYLNE